jgi:hypothetical protein
MFKVGDKVILKSAFSNADGPLEPGTVYTVRDLDYNYRNIRLSYKYSGGTYDTEKWYSVEKFKLFDKHYFVNDNRTLMTEEEAMEYLRKNGGGTLYKKVLTMKIETKTVEEIEKHG